MNKRLAGDKSEDPNFPKTEFPSAEACPSCKTPKGIWDEDVVCINFNFILGWKKCGFYLLSADWMTKEDFNMLNFFMTPELLDCLRPLNLSISMTSSYVLFFAGL